MTELELFEAAIAIADPLERAALLDRACAGKPGLRERLDELLEAHGRPQGLLDWPDEGGRTMAAEVPAKTAAGVIIAGRYKLLEEIGDGGMGTVWMAEQRAPVKRLVAVKLIKAGMDSKAVLARFEAERQALAVMDHPNIAKVLDAGTDEKGRPYFVMELVKGLSLMEYCDARRLSVKDRLELFVQICSAIQHAHQKAVIHRDLKPSNVLVTEHDGKPVPKVIDFGLAKALGATNTLTDKTLHTAYGAVVGTPLYMAPEQVGINALDVDTRTDIYALGVILYELLTGSTPLEKARFKEAAWDEVKRLIREEEPPRPSIRLSSAQTLPSLAACRQIEPMQLRKLVRGELDWIVMKALEKDRSRRYETANGLAKDIHRYLSNEAVEACPPTAGYRLRKFARRYRTALMTTAAISILLVGGITVSTLLAISATRAKDDARASAKSEHLAKLEAQKSAAAEKQANEQSQKRLAQIEKSTEIITSIFDDLDLRKVKEGTEPLEVVLAKRLLTAAKQLEGDAVGDPLAVAELQYRLSASLHSLGHVREATDLAVKARDAFAARLGPDHRDTLKATRAVADYYGAAGRWRAALPMWEDALRRAKANFGPDDHLTLMCVSGLASCYHYANMLDRAVPMQEEVTATLKLKKGPDHVDTLNAMCNTAISYKDAGNMDRAIATLEEVVKLHKARGGVEHADAINWRATLAGCYTLADKHELALPLIAEVVAWRKANLGSDHAETIIAIEGQGQLYLNAGKPAEAIPVLEGALGLVRAKFGTAHVNALRPMGSLGQAYVDAGKSDLALPLLEESLALSKKLFGADTPMTVELMLRLAKCYGACGRAGEGLAMLERALAIARAKLRPDGSVALTCVSTLALAYHKAGKLDRAIALNDEFIRIEGARAGPDSPDVLRCKTNQAGVYLSAGRPDLALPLYEDVTKHRRARLGPEHPETVGSIIRAGHTFQALGKPDQALKQFEEALEIRRASLGNDHLDTLAIMSHVGVCYWQAKRLDKSIPLFKELLEMAERKLGRDHPFTLSTATNLGVNLRDARRFDEAIPLLEEAHLASAKHESLRWAGKELLVALVSAEKLDPAMKLLGEQLALYNNQLPGDDLRGWLSWSAILDAIGGDLIRAKRFAEAEPLFRMSLALREKHTPDAWLTFNTMSGLGMTLLGQKKYADAEPVLRKSYEGLKQREQTIPKTGDSHLRMVGILDRLMEVSIAIEKPDDVNKWRAERAKYPATTQPGKGATRPGQK